MYNRYISFKDDNLSNHPLTEWASNACSVPSIINTKANGKPSFAINNTDDELSIRLSLFCEYEFGGKICRRGNFYIKITQWISIKEVEEYIISLADYFYINTKDINIYKVKNVQSANIEKYIVLEIPEMSVRRNKLKNECYHLPDIFDKMTRAIHQFTQMEYAKKQHENIKIEYDLYKKGFKSCIEYCISEIEAVKINDNCRVQTGEKKFNLFEFAAYKSIYELMNSCKDSSIDSFISSCRLFNYILGRTYFSKINLNDIFLKYLVIAILNLKTNNTNKIIDIKNIAKEILSPTINAMLKKGSFITCSGLQCKFYKHKCNCKSIKNPFLLFNIMQYNNISILRDYPSFNTKKLPKQYFSNIISKYFNLSDCHNSIFLLPLFMFITIAVSNCRFSVLYSHRIYNNCSPFILIFSNELLLKHCNELILMINELNIHVLKNIKSTAMAKLIRKNSVFTIFDTMESGRFSILHIASSYSVLSEKCIESITKFGLFDTDKSSRINTLIVSHREQFKDYINKRPRSLLGKLQKFIIFDESRFHNFDINAEALKEYFSKIDKNLSQEQMTFDLEDLNLKYNLVDETLCLFDEYGLSDIYDLKFKVNVLATAIIFSSLFIFVDKDETHVKFGDEEHDLCLFILDKILSNITRSLRKFRNPIFDFCDKIRKKILYTKDSPLYISRREIYRSLNVRENNKDMHRAIQHLIDVEDLVEIYICLKQRKGRPHGTIYYVPKNENSEYDWPFSLRDALKNR